MSIRSCFAAYCVLHIQPLGLEGVSKKGYCATIAAFRGRVDSARQIGSAHGCSKIAIFHRLLAHGMPTATDLDL
ncbi:MAG: hypothetical protein LBP99_04415 [Azoarcus sp.]|jgi:hypothetical protein|nr:hypothetical protein [Azoarcus sp.]